MKKFLSLILAFACCLFTLGFTACGTGSGDILIYSTAEQERIAFFNQELQKQFPDYNVYVEPIGTGELFTKLQNEGENTDCDIVHDVLVSNAEQLISENENLFYDLSQYDFSIYVDSVTTYTSRHKKYAPTLKLDCALIVNTAKLSSLGLPIPETYEDLTQSIYDGLISVPNPKTSGTGYCFYSGLVELMGEIDTLDYLDRLSKNKRCDFTKSGSQILTDVNSGEKALGVGMMYQGALYANENPNLKIKVLENKAPYALYSMAMINGRETEEGVKEVFDYFYNTLVKADVETFNLGKVYKDQAPITNQHIPTGYENITMSREYDFEYKAYLLDKFTK
jgi:iron(III) transport system substrate-binding protein